MKTKLLLGAGAATLVMAGGAGIEIARQAGEPRAAFINPALLAQSVCGDAADASAMRRAFFVKLGGAAAARMQETQVAGNDPVPIGAIAYEVTTASPEAQAHFNLGVAHMWNFNHGAAVEAFRAAQAADPDCAMCYWGEALAHGPNINAPMAEEAVAPAWQALEKARAAEGADEKERALIEALAVRYGPEPAEDRAPLDEAFAEAMDDVALAYPEDDFIAALAAEANMDTQPWDYWMSDGRTPKGRAARTISLLEAILARNPDYIPAIHLYIHMTEATSDPYRAASYADRLEGLSPGLGHLIHMPSHTYYRIGRYKESLASNIGAVEADEAFLAATEASPMYEYGYYVHNIHMLMATAHMAGDGATTLETGKKLDARLPSEMVEAVPFAQPIKAAPYYAMAQHADPDEILALPDPGETAPFIKANWHYARGEAYARRGEPENAHEEAAAIAALIAGGDFSALEQTTVPFMDILNIARLTVTARAAAAQDDLDTAVEAMTEAVAIQDALAYTEPPYWYYPSKQTLAALVLRRGEAERAEQLFLEALVEAPNNGWVLYGLSEAYRAQGDRNGARYATGLFKQAWAGDRKAVSTDRL